MLLSSILILLICFLDAVSKHKDDGIMYVDKKQDISCCYIGKLSGNALCFRRGIAVSGILETKCCVGYAQFMIYI